MMWVHLIAIYFLVMSTCAVTPIGEHVCQEEERYLVNVTQHFVRNATVRTYQWCMRIPPRCSTFTYRTLNDSRIVEEQQIRYKPVCCDGYHLDGSGEKCVPVCNNCVNGDCNEDHKCYCHPGYRGDHCEKPCEFSRWGRYCRYHCTCERGACNSRTGHCECPNGWTGTRCETRCHGGYFGPQCKSHCDCQSTESCDPTDGHCTLDEADKDFKRLSKKVKQKTVNLYVLSGNTISSTATTTAEPEHPISHVVSTESTTEFHETAGKSSESTTKWSESTIKLSESRTNLSSLTTRTSITSTTQEPSTITTTLVQTSTIQEPSTTTTTQEPLIRTTTSTLKELSVTMRTPLIKLTRIEEPSITSSTQEPLIKIISTTIKEVVDVNININSVDVTKRGALKGKAAGEVSGTRITSSPAETRSNDRGGDVLSNRGLISLTTIIGAVALLVIAGGVHLALIRFRRGRENETRIRVDDKRFESAPKSIFHTPLPDPPTSKNYESTTFIMPSECKQRQETTRAETKVNTYTSNKDYLELFYDHPPSTGGYKPVLRTEEPNFHINKTALHPQEPLYDEIPCWTNTSNEEDQLYINSVMEDTTRF